MIVCWYQKNVRVSGIFLYLRKNYFDQLGKEECKMGSPSNFPIHRIPLQVYFTIR